MLDDQLAKGWRRAQDQAGHGALLGDVKGHSGAETGGGDEDGFAGRLFGDGVVGGDGGGGEAIQSGCSARSAEAGMIDGPHFDRFFTPAANESTGVPLSAFGVAAEA